MLHSLFRSIVWYSAFLANFRRYFRPLRCVFQEWNFSAEVLLYSGTIRHFFFGLMLSHLPLFLSLFLARSQALELEHLSRESEESATRYGPERANLLLHSPPVSSLAFYNAFLPVFARLHFCTRAHIALARVFLENRGLLLWGRPTDGLRNRRCSLTVCRGASAAPPSRLVLPPVALRASFDRVPLSLSILLLLLLPLLSSPASSVCLRSSLSLSLSHARRASIQVIVFRPIFPRDRRFFSFESNAESFSRAIVMFPKKKGEKKQYNLQSDEKERGRVRN